MVSAGVEFRDPMLLLTAKNENQFRAGMYFNLVVGFANIPLTPQVAHITRPAGCSWPGPLPPVSISPCRQAACGSLVPGPVCDVPPCLGPL